MKLRMDCVNQCIAYGFITGTLLSIITPVNDGAFKKSMDDNQLHIYNFIRKERMIIFTLSSIFSMLFVHILKINGWFKIVLYYILMGALYKCWPKTYYMVEYLRENQLELWNGIYKDMQYKHAFALLIGVLSVPVMCKLDN